MPIKPDVLEFRRPDAARPGAARLHRRRRAGAGARATPTASASSGGWRAALIVLCLVRRLCRLPHADRSGGHLHREHQRLGRRARASPVLGWAVGGAVLAVIAASSSARSRSACAATISRSPRSASPRSSARFVKNMDWLTRGTLTVSPMPWPVPLPQELQAERHVDRQLVPRARGSASSR